MGHVCALSVFGVKYTSKHYIYEICGRTLTESGTVDSVRPVSASPKGSETRSGGSSATQPKRKTRHERSRRRVSRQGQNDQQISRLGLQSPGQLRPCPRPLPKE